MLEGIGTTEIVIIIFLGIIPAAIAHRKGENFVKWWIYGSLLFIIALIHAVLLKPSQESIERAQLSSGMKKCPFCAEIIKQEAIVCRYCGRDVGIPNAKAKTTDTLNTNDQSFLDAPERRIIFTILVLLTTPFLIGYLYVKIIGSNARETSHYIPVRSLTNSTPSAPSINYDSSSINAEDTEIEIQERRIVKENSSEQSSVVLHRRMSTALTDFPYQSLVYDAQEYIGKSVGLVGLVKEKRTSQGKTTFILFRNGDSSQPFFITYRNSFNMRNDQRVALFGYYGGLDSNKSTPIPSIVASIVETPEQMARLYSEVMDLGQSTSR